MNDLIADTYVVVWKHFEASKDENWLAAGVCGLHLLLALVNGVLVIVLFVGKGHETFQLSKPACWLLGAVTGTACVYGMKLFVARRSDLQSPDKIEKRYSGLSTGQRLILGSTPYVNAGLFMLLNYFRTL